MDLDDCAADVSGLRIPGNAVADFEVCFHFILSNAFWRHPVHKDECEHTAVQQSRLPQMNHFISRMARRPARRRNVEPGGKSWRRRTEPAWCRFLVTCSLPHPLQFIVRLARGNGHVVTGTPKVSVKGGQSLSAGCPPVRHAKSGRMVMSNECAPDVLASADRSNPRQRHSAKIRQ